MDPTAAIKKFGLEQAFQYVYKDPNRQNTCAASATAMPNAGSPRPSSFGRILPETRQTASEYSRRCQNGSGGFGHFGFTAQKTVLQAVLSVS